MFGFSGSEILLIAVIALILFGNDKLPENMKKMIKGLNQAKKVTRDVQNSWQEVKNDVQSSLLLEEEKKEINDIAQKISSLEADINSVEFQSEDIPQQEIDAYQNHIETQAQNDTETPLIQGQNNTMDRDKNLNILH
ncbi:twin-arginine translocase TatA/TatE family subunit [Spirobacillus cienkowskii]|uniref:Sec-independent protein translocase subunit TatA/TatB n=1 Tax=Spirobacillus cienkowskii TaxID=495820 RepID=UPI0030D13E39